MTRLKSIPLAIGALVLLAGTVAAFRSMPAASAPGLEKAGDAAGKTVPVRAVPVDGSTVEVPVNEPADAPAVDLPDAASHGAAVSAAARAEDTTPDTNHGADVSAVARDNAGQAAAAAHKPSSAGKPDGAGKPAAPGKPVDPGRP